MSTSTISRAEDTQRMKELEDTFEERYMKVKYLLYLVPNFMMVWLLEFHLPPATACHCAYGKIKKNPKTPKIQMPMPFRFLPNGAYDSTV